MPSESYGANDPELLANRVVKGSDDVSKLITR